MTIASIGQAIIQATIPQVILAPPQLTLGIQFHRHFASRFLNDSLYKHRFRASYNDVESYETSAVVPQGTNISSHGDESVQYTADNVDHSVRTTDGHNTFHGMVITAVVTQEVSSCQTVFKVKITSKEISSTGCVNIQISRLQHNCSMMISQLDLQMILQPI